MFLVRSEFLLNNPNHTVLRILEATKQALLDCVKTFGWRRMAGLVPNFLEEEGLGGST